MSFKQFINENMSMNLKERFKDMMKAIDELPGDYSYKLSLDTLDVKKGSGGYIAYIPKKEANEVKKWIEIIKNFKPADKTPKISDLDSELKKAIKSGKKVDFLNIDVTIIKDGWFVDTSRMYAVGETSILAKRLTEVTYECMWLGIAQVKPGNTLGDIGNAIQKYAEQQGFSVVREFCGHGIGQKFHQDPQILHYGKAGSGLKLEPGLIFTIEPMINAGKRDIRQLADGWTVVTRDHSLSAQWEHTIMVTEAGFEVLTQSPGMPAPPPFITL
jgi:methionine aminopeptidase type I